MACGRRSSSGLPRPGRRRFPLRRTLRAAHSVKVHDLAAEEAQAAARAARQEMEAAAKSELSAVQARLQGELEKERAEFEVRRTTLEAQLADTERDITAIRRKRDDHAASLDEARRRIDALEEANAQSARFQQVAAARLEEEVQRRTTVAKQLDAARQEILLATAEADSCRLEAHLAGERVTAVENRLLQLEQATAQTRTTSALEGEKLGVLQHLKKGLDDLTSAKSEEILSRLVGQLSDSFAVAAVFTVDAQRLKLWKGRVGDARAAAIATSALSLESESLLARAFKHRTTVSVDMSAGDGAGRAVADAAWERDCPARAGIRARGGLGVCREPTWPLGRSRATARNDRRDSRRLRQPAPEP